MFEDEPLDQATWAVLAPMIAEQKAQKLAIVGLLASFPEGTWMGGDELAELMGIRWARRQLTELVDAHILDRDDGDGSRQFWYRVNPRWWEWTVRWRHPVARVRELVDEWKRRTEQHPIEVFSARPSARHSVIGARLSARYSADGVALKVLEAALARAPARAKPQVGANAKELARAAARANSNQRALQRALKRPRPKEEESTSVPSLPSDDEYKSSSSQPAAPVTEITGRRPSRRQPTPAEQRVRAVVLSRCLGQKGRRPWIEGVLEAQLYALVDQYGADEVISAAKEVPAGVENPPRFIGILTDDLAIRALDADARDAVEHVSAIELEAKRQEDWDEMLELRQKLSDLQVVGRPLDDAELDRYKALCDRFAFHPNLAVCDLDDEITTESPDTDWTEAGAVARARQQLAEQLDEARSA